MTHTILCLEGSTPQDRDGASPPSERYRCGSKGAYFVLPKAAILLCGFPSAYGQTRRVGRFRQASLLAWMNITAWLKGRKPRESNKLFDLFPPQANPLNPSNPWQKRNPEDRGFSLFIALRWMQEPCWVMVGLTENIQACLRDFLAGTTSMARKRHFASSARGFCGFCLMTLVTTGLFRSIRLIRGRKQSRGQGFILFLSYDQLSTRHESPTTHIKSRP